MPPECAVKAQNERVSAQFKLPGAMRPQSHTAAWFARMAKRETVEVWGGLWGFW